MKIEYKLYSMSELRTLLEITNKKFDGQRKYKEWSMSDSLKFIESLYLGYPIPSFFIARDSHNNSYMVDGQHRYKTFSKMLKIINEYELHKAELSNIYLDRADLTGYDFIKKNFGDLAPTISRYVVNVVFLKMKTEAQIMNEGVIAFNYLNSTRNDIPDGNIVKNSLTTIGISSGHIDTITNFAIKYLRYTDAKINKEFPLLDYVRSIYFSTIYQLIPQGGVNFGIPKRVNKALNSNSEFKEVIKSAIKDNNFNSKFYKNLKNQGIGLNKKNLPINSVASTYLYPILGLSFKMNNPELISKPAYEIYLKIIDELLNKDDYAEYKSFVFGSVKRTTSSFLILEGILDGTIASTQDFVNKYFNEV